MQRFYRIGEVSKLCDISIKTLRYYEDFGLISPVEVDIYTGYRYYNQKNVETIYKIQFLKSLGFSLNEIKDFDENSLFLKAKDLKQQMKSLRENLKIISSLNNQKGEKIMKPFINDVEAIGKWKYVASALSKEDFASKNYHVDKNIFLKTLYFLPNGEGYWFIDRWTKGMIYHFRGDVYKYSIEKDYLFLEVYSNNEFEMLLIFKRVDSKKYSKEEIKKQDEVEIPFVLDKKAVGFWKAVDFISIKNKKDYKFNGEKDKFVKQLILNPDGKAVIEYENEKFGKIDWSKGVIINKTNKTASKYEIRKIENEEFMFMEWKSGDYIFGGFVEGCYVFRKIK